MFIRFSTLLPIAALVAVATAVPNALEARGSCDTGPNYCCNQVLPVTDPTVTQVAQTNSISLSGITGDVGLTCNPITVIGTGSGGTCVQQPVCCTGNDFQGIIVVGCTPITVVA